MKSKSLDLFLILMVVFFFLVSCGSKEQETSREKQEWEQKVKEIRTTLINRYHPIVFPSKDFGRGKVFTYQIEKYLITEDGKPVLFNGTLDDINKDGDHFTVHLSSHLTDYEDEELGFRILDNRRVRFHLKCKWEHVKSLIEKIPEPTDVIFTLLSPVGEFCVVGVVKEIKKIRYTVRGHQSGPEDVELEVESPDLFSVTGELLEMIEYPKHPEYRLD